MQVQAAWRPGFAGLLKDSGVLVGSGLALTPKPRMVTISGGDWRSMFRGQGMEFESVRAYVSGDEVRHIDWRVTARTGKPHVKLFHEEHQRRLVMMVDDSASMHFATRGVFKNILAARLAAILGGAALARGEGIQGAVWSCEADELAMRPCTGRGKKSLLTLLRAVSEEGDALRSLPALRYKVLEDGRWLTRLAAGAGMTHGADVVVISDFRWLPQRMNEAWVRAFLRIGHEGQLLLLRVADAGDAELPSAGLLPMQDGSGKKMSVNTDSSQLRQRWKMLWEAQTAQLQEIARKTRGRMWTVWTDEDPKTALQALLRGGGTERAGHSTKQEA